MDHAAFELQIKRLQAEASALQRQLMWFNRMAIALAALSLPGAAYSYWVPGFGFFFAASLAGVAKYIGTVHMQSTRERIADLDKQLGRG